MTAKRKPLSEQVIVLTGATNGIGLCTAQLAALLGARLVFISRTDHVLDGLLGIIEAAGGRAMHVRADICEREELVAAAQAVVGHFGRIDTWINNASISIYGRLDQISEADSRRLFDINFWGVVNGSLAALPHLVAAGGSLINVGSEARVLTPRQGMYSSSKQAVKGFTDALRMEAEGMDAAPVAITLIEPDLVGPKHAVDPVQVAEAILGAAGGGGGDGNRMRRAADQPSNTSQRNARPATPARPGRGSLTVGVL